MEKGTSFQKRNRWLAICLFATVCCLPLRAQTTLVAAEYFIDVDPGAGLATPIAVTPDDSLDMTFTASVAGLPSGFHRLVARVRDSESGWSTVQEHLFYISPLLSPFVPPPPPFTLIEAEYFFNADPGPGNGTAFQFIAGDSVNIIRTFTAAGLSAATHKIGVRFRDLSGAWGTAQWQQFTVTDTTGQTPPQADFNWGAAVAGSPVAFTNTSQNLLPGSVAQWDILADGSVDYTTPNAAHTFATPGIYDVALRVANPGSVLDTTGLKALYRFWGGSLTDGYALLGNLAATGDFATAAGRQGDPEGAYSTTSANQASWLSSASDSLNLSSFSLSYWFKGTDQRDGLRLVSANTAVRSTFSGSHYVGGQAVNANSTTAQNGQWHHVALTWVPNSAGGFRSYLDGQLVQSVNSVAANVGPLVSLAIGGLASYQARGAFDDVYLFNRVLTDAEVLRLYNEAVSSTIVKQIVVGPVPPNVISASGPLTFCAGDSVVLTAPAGTGHVWGNGHLGQTLTAHASGTYTCAYTDINGFSRTTNTLLITVHENPDVQITIFPAINGLANGGAGLSVSGGNAFFYDYSWSTGATVASVGGLLAGTYSVTVDDGVCPQMLQITVPDSTIQPLEGIVAAEYFINTDPGVGNGTPIVVSPGDTAGGFAAVPLPSNLPVGLHQFSVRAKDHLGQWGIAQAVQFSVFDTFPVPPPEPRGDIVAAEYFWDTDPGAGNGTAIAVAVPSDTVDATFFANAAGLSIGYHKLCIRTKDERGYWSIAQTANIFVDIVAPPPLPDYRAPIVYAEYFIGDTDPAPGQGTPIPVPTSPTDLDVNRTINVANLPVGTHRLSVRVRDVLGNWAVVKSATFQIQNLGCTPPTVAFSVGGGNAGQPISLINNSTGTTGNTTYTWDIGANGSVEYTTQNAAHTFSNPGVYDVKLTINNGDNCQTSLIQQVMVGPILSNAISASGPLEFCSGDSVVLTAPAGSEFIWSTGDTTASITVMQTGAYQLTYLNTQGNPATASALLVTVHPSLQATMTVNPEINGNSNGSAGVSVTGGTGYLRSYAWSTGAELPIVTQLGAGTYTVTISDVFCPKTLTATVLNQTAVPLTGIVAAEYFIDNADPGAGNGTPIPISQGAISQSFVNVAATGLLPGLHKLTMRAKDHLGQWSIAQTAQFSVFDTLPEPPPEPKGEVVWAEYFFDTDPGAGNGTPVPSFAPDDSLNHDFAANTAGLLPGVHQLGLRVRDSNGKWGFARIHNIYILDVPQPPVSTVRYPVVGAEYFLGDTDPGVGNGTAIPVPASENLDVNRTLDVGGLPPGTYRLNVRVRDLAGNWSPTKTSTFAVSTYACPTPQVNFTNSAANTGQPMSLLNASTNLLGGASYAWDIGANGSVEYTTANAAHTFAMPGIYDVKLTVSNGGLCVSNRIRQVVVGPVLSNAIVANGPLEFCAGDSVVLTAPAGTGHTWTTGETTLAIVVRVSGTYEATYTDVQGNLRVTPPVTVTAHPSMNIALEINPETNNGSNGSAGVTVAGGSAYFYDYAWSTGDTLRSVAGLQSGIYTVTVDDGQCPQIIEAQVVDSTIQPLQGIVAAEYFIDVDPGAGNAGPLPISQGNVAAAFANISLTGILPGLHKVCVRVKDHLGSWSHAVAHSIFVSEPQNPPTPEPLGDIVAAEYFFDADPGIGGGIGLIVSSQEAIWDTIYQLPMTGLSPGLHKISVRAKDSNGKWSITRTGTFNNCNPPAAPTAGPNVAICEGGTVALTSTPNGGTGILWSGPNNYSSTLQNPTIPNATAGQTGTYLVQATSPGGCNSIPDTVLVRVDNPPGQPGQIVGLTSICGQDTVVYFVPPVPGAVSYQWEIPPGAFFLAGNNSNSVAVDFSQWADSVGTVQVTASNTCGSAQSPPFAIGQNLAPPVAACQNISVALDNAGQASISAAQVNNNSTVGCGDISLAVAPNMFDCSDVGVSTVMLTVTAPTGQTATCQSTVTVADVDAPVLQCSDVTVLLGASGQASLSVGDVDAGSADNCGISGLSLGQTTFDCGDVGANTVTLTATDASGNTAACTAAVTVQDLVPPVSLCQDVTVDLGSSGQAGIAAGEVDGGSSDACGVASLVVAPAAFDCTDLGPNVVTLFVTDSSGNVFSCQSEVFVRDVSAPVALCQAATVYVDGSGQAVLTAAQVDGGSSDNCVGVSLSVSPSSFSCPSLGLHTAVLTVVDGSGNTSACTASVTVSDSTPVSVAIVGVPAVCGGQPTALTAAGGTSHQWSTGATSATVSIASAGVYTVTATDGGGCTATATVTVSSGAAPTAGISGASSLCAGTPTPLTASGGSSYLWSTGATGAVASVASAGTYTVTVTGAAGCTATKSKTLTLKAAPNAAIGGPAGLCGGIAAVLTASGGSAYLWSTGAATASVTIGAPGVYTVTVTGGNGCTASASRAMSELPGAAAAVSGPASICAGSTGTLTATGGGTYLWSTGGATAGVNVTSAGTYTVTVTDANGCTASASKAVSVKQPPVAGINGPSAICSGQAATLTGTGAGAGGSYLWSTGAATTSISVGSNGTYRVTVTNSTGCTASASRQLTVNASPSASITGTAQICAGGSTVLTASPPGAAAYLWGTGAAAQSITAAANGSYRVTVTAANGCTGTATRTVTYKKAPTVAISGTSPICSGTSTAFTASGGASYLWGTGATTASINVNTAGTYTVTATGTNGCTASASKILNLKTAPNAQIAGNNSVCAGQASTFTASGGGTYLWGNGQATASINVNTAGAYTVTVTHATNGCTSSASRTLTVNAQPVAQIAGPGILCGDAPATLTASGGANGEAYQWNTGATAASIAASSAGSYTVTVTASGGCTSSATKALAQHPAASAAISGPDGICGGLSATFTASGGQAYQWNTGQTTATINTSPAATTVYAVTATAASGCTASAEKTLTVAPSPTAGVSGPSSICAGQTAAFTASGGGTYLWSTGETTDNVALSQNGAYTVTVTAANGCTDAEEKTLTVHPLPAASITGVPAICSGSPAALTATGGQTYLWSDNQATATITVPQTGVYTVTATGPGGCTASASVTVVAGTTPNPVVNGPGSVCPNQSIELTATGGGSYLWSTGAATATTSVNAPGTYRVTVTGAEGCTATRSKGVTQRAAPTASISGNGETCPGGTGAFTASGGGSYLWSTGAATALINVSPAATTAYTVTVTAANGCTDAEEKTLTVHPFPPASIAGTDLCDGQPTVLTASGGTSYAWGTGQTTAAITVSQAGVYTATVTGAGGCTASAEKAVAQSDSPTAGISADTAVCLGGQAALTATGGQAYLWGNGQNTASITVSPAAATTYTVTVTGAGGCTATAGATVQVNALPGLAVAGAASFCAGGSAALTASANGSFEWSNGQTTASITVGQAGVYTVTATAANGCTETGSAAVSELALPDPAITPAAPFIGCGNASATLTAHGGGSYLWSTGQSTASITVSPASTTAYTVTVTGANGCTASGEKTVSVPAALSVSVTRTNVTCFGAADGSLTASPAGGTPPFSYVWQKDGVTVGTAQSLVGLGPGTYQLTLTDANGCTDTRPGNVVTEPLPLELQIVSAGPDPGDPGAFRVEVSSTGGNAAHRYRRCTAAGACTAYGTGTVFAGLAAGNWSFWVRDSKGCVDSANVALPPALRGVPDRAAAPAAPGLTVSPSPHPGAGPLALLFRGAPGGAAEVELLDAQGRAVWRGQVAVAPGGTAGLPLPGLPAGTYAVRAAFDGRHFATARLTVADR